MTYSASAAYHYTLGMVLDPGHGKVKALAFTTIQIGALFLYAVKNCIPLPKLCSMIGTVIQNSSKKASFENVLTFVDEVLLETALEAQAIKSNDELGILSSRMRVFELTLIKAHEYGFNEQVIV